MNDDYDVIPFSAPGDWRAWLVAHHANTQGIWVRLYKKGTSTPSITYAEALDEALCFGWIDGLKRSYDSESYVLRFTPRRTKSLWSKQNIEHIERLTSASKMAPSGMAEVERAKQDGRWQAAYDKPSEMQVPDEFLIELKKHPRAAAFFKTLSKSNTYAIAWRLQTAKTEETRLRRQAKIIDQLNNEQKLV